MIFFCCRIKFEGGCTSRTEFYHGDTELPIHSRLTSGYRIGDLVNVLLKEDNATRKVCTVQPLGVAENAAFVVDVETVDLQDLRADDLGSWHPTGTKKSFFRFCPSGTLRISTQCPRGALSNYYVVTRRYYVHKSYDKYHRQIADVRGESDYETFLIQGGYTQERMKTM